MFIWKSLPILLRILIVITIMFAWGFCFVICIPPIYTLLTHPHHP
jgi:hypothetical protein